LPKTNEVSQSESILRVGIAALNTNAAKIFAMAEGK
jgi:hypothetical protein